MGSYHFSSIFVFLFLSFFLFAVDSHCRVNPVSTGLLWKHLVLSMRLNVNVSCQGGFMHKPESFFKKAKMLRCAEIHYYSLFIIY